MIINLKTAKKRIKEGHVGIIPTDTVYGLVCNAHDKKAVRRLYDLKKREQKPGTVIAGSVNALVHLGIKKKYLKAVEHYWPNSVSVIVPCGEDLSYLHQGKRSLAVRIPKVDEASMFINENDVYLSSSANMPGEPPATNINEAKAYFKDAVDFYVDGGAKSAEASTVIEVLDDTIHVLRQGSVIINNDGSIQR